MKATELRAGLEVLVLERGRRTRLADAETYRATILCEETFASSCGGFGELTMVDGPDGVSYEVYGALSTTGNRVALLVEDGRGGVRTEVVLKSRILGPVKPAEARVAAAKRKWAEQGRALRKALVERAKLERRLTSVLRGAGFDESYVAVGHFDGLRNDTIAFVIRPEQLEAFESLLSSARDCPVDDTGPAIGCVSSR